MLKKLFYASALIALTACSESAPSTDYTVTVECPVEEATVYMVNFDSGEKIDSAVVQDNKVVFTGKVEKPELVRIIVDGARKSRFFLEPGDITVTPDSVKGGELNAKMDKFQNEYAEIMSEYDQLSDSIQATSQEIYMQRIDSLSNVYMNDNIDNAFGYYLFLNKAYEMTLDELNKAIEQTPSLGEYQRVKKLQDSLGKKAKTSEGAMFQDFEIPGSLYGETFKLSDVVGKGDYVLVDFWASWCGPCIRETAVLKDIYKEYNPKGLKIIGIAVWDEPENTQQAIQEHELPWQHVINAQTIPTDAYGISGIPCIILFGPDGTIIARDKMGDELRKAVADAMTK